MRIALNAMQVRAAKSGVGQYIHGLVEALLPEAPTDRFVLYCSPQNVRNYRFQAPNYEARVWGLPEKARTLRLLYEYSFLPSELARCGYDLFHGLSNFLPPRKVTRYVVSIHDLAYYVHPERCPWLRRQYWYAMTRRTVEVADAIITGSQASRRDIEHFFPATRGRIRVIPDAAHHRFRKLEVPREQTHLPALGIDFPYILFVGTLEPGKNVERVIRAFDAIADRFPRHHLVVAGDRGWLYQGIYEAAAQARAASRIHLIGHQVDEVVVELMNFCELFVFPSLYEGFGLPPLEAMACGAPVITSKVSSLPEVVGDAALLVDPLETEEIAAAMERVLSDELLRRQMCEKGLERSRQFSWKNCARETLRVYQTVLGIS
ncbi:MAG: glycosyltransferase family 4 protein [Candidatus Sumerlaeaceae bacterium]|nr:glycosyltransferase family 4 protein [Candidatus Sumerlaeaceae bacterium]